MLPAHTSHFLQPLDVVVFQPLKHFHAKAVDDATRRGCSSFDKVEFLHAIDGIRKNTFKRNTILSAFRLTGLVPFNPSIVLHKIEEFQPPAAFQPQSGRFQTPSEDEFDDPETPMTTRGLEKLSLRLKAAEEGSLSRRKAIQDKFIKGALIQSKAGAALKTTLKENTAYGEARRLRHQRSQGWLQTGGTLSVADARDMKLQKETEGGRGRDRAARRENQLQRRLYDEQQKFKRLVESLPEELRPSESSESESDEI